MWATSSSRGQSSDCTGGGLGVFAQRFGGLRPQALVVDAAGNHVLDPGEAAVVQPTWRNINGASLTFGGTLTDLTGPAGPAYTIADGIAGYGTVRQRRQRDLHRIVMECRCPAPRPAAHWDASAVETITPDTLGQQKQWVLHVGGSFTDVSAASPFYRFIETLLHRGVTGGCRARPVLPGRVDDARADGRLRTGGQGGHGLRAARLRARPVFADVPASSPFCRWIEELARRGVVNGCGGGNYCPADPVSREQMAVFVLRTLDPALNPPACTTPMFTDVPASSPFCRGSRSWRAAAWSADAAAATIAPRARSPASRWACSLSVTFGLTLYGP